MSGFESKIADGEVAERLNATVSKTDARSHNLPQPSLISPYHRYEPARSLAGRPCFSLRFLTNPLDGG